MVNMQWVDNLDLLRNRQGILLYAMHKEIFPAGYSNEFNHGQQVFIRFIVPNQEPPQNAYDYMLFIPWNISSITSPVNAKVKKHAVGSLADNDLRYVYQLIGPEYNTPLRVGLTVHAVPGGWSSTPHPFEEKHIKNPAPPEFWEQFAYMTDPKDGWGVQVRTGHLSMLDGNATMFNKSTPVRGYQTEQIPLGSHPLTGGPGVTMAYFWAYTGKLIELMEKF